MGRYKNTFELHTETLIEASKHLAKTEDAYESYLAMEMRLALEESDVDWRDWVGEGFGEAPDNCPQCGRDLS